MTRVTSALISASFYFPTGCSILAAYTPETFKSAVEELLSNIERIMNVSGATFNGLNLAPLLNIGYTTEDPAMWQTLRQMQNTYINITDFDLGK